ncbi:hypothetical protein [Kitasatospora atroaurantiaca]|uniref:Uncharacterized protein n=1 Tax=Kitasatospora atroaurantiaca TaxID=285545 RepID=A0A561ENN3_9ACTN|nr:hypothetical protein [Kitasatospora atroaurantiaca]TWE17202.1 hypothetical protein FB465_2210 [Kitasatospora atroaurantiaca]
MAGEQSREAVGVGSQAAEGGIAGSGAGTDTGSGTSAGATSAAEPGATAGPSKPQLVLASLVMACYIAFLIVLVSKRGDENWDRLVYLFSGFEAIVFAAAGMVFGTSVQRSQLNAARQEAAVAKEDAARNAQDAQHLNALSAIIEAKAAGPAPNGYPAPNGNQAPNAYPAANGYPAADASQPPAGTFGGRPNPDPTSPDPTSPDPYGRDPHTRDPHTRDPHTRDPRGLALNSPAASADLAELARIVQAIRSTRG